MLTITSKQIVTKAFTFGISSACSILADTMILWGHVARLLDYSFISTDKRKIIMS